MRKLSKEHLAELQASGLSEETIEKAGIYTETNPLTVCQLLNHTSNGIVKNSHAMVIPFGYDGYLRVKLSDPRLRNGKPIKYESPFGSEQHPYFPPDTFDEIAKHDDTREVFIVEGEKKALKLWQDLRDNDIDAHVIGLTGVYGWKKKQQETLLPWLESIHWTNRNVFICFDNDVHWNKNVSDARRRLAKVLKNYGANVKAIEIPITDPMQKYGVDDYIVKFGIVSYFDCLANAKEIGTKDVIHVEIISAFDVEVVPVEWLWHLYIPKGEITLLDGNPGLGKSQMIADLAARVSRGFAMPPIETGKPITSPKNVLLLCAEDTIEKTVKPRLSVCGANMKRVFFLKTAGKPLVFPQDLERFEQECFELEIDLVVIDPIMSYIGRDIDTHSDHSSRDVLNRLKEFAEHTNTSIVCLRHLNKKSGDAAIYRGGGSIAFSASSRCNLVVGKHPTEEETNVLACIKSNLERKPKSLAYAIESVDTQWGPIGKIQWLEEVALTADDVVDIDKSAKKVNRTEHALEITRNMLLQNGPMLSVELQSEISKACGISPTKWQLVRKQLNLLRGRKPEERAKGPWWSKLPGQSFQWEQGKQAMGNGSKST